MLCKRALGKPRFDLSKDMPIVLKLCLGTNFRFHKSTKPGASILSPKSNNKIVAVLIFIFVNLNITDINSRRSIYFNPLIHLNLNYDPKPLQVS